ncbi:MAG: efflux RND transporter periplasmic adaptor subunit [Pseudonocardia sp.]|nr:efflux RND transporter periplasmic adaptor subunit [Pseudonocardia sp.]
MRVARGLFSALSVALKAGSLVVVVLLLVHGALAAKGIAVRPLDAVARTLSLGTPGLFAWPAVNSGVAALAWLGIAAVFAVLTRQRTRARPHRRASPGKPTTSRVSRVLFITVGVLSVLETAGFASSYFLYSSHYVTTDNAQVDGDKIDINAPVSGAVSDWAIQPGSVVEPNQIVGRIRMLGSGAQPERTVKVPGANTGTVAVDDVVDGSYVTAGSELATAYDLAKIYVIARVEDYDIASVRPGALVDVHVDAFPNAPVTGIVEVVQNSTAGNFTIYPPAGTADPSQPQRVDQYIPVKIKLLSTGDARLVPGMDVTAHIHKS